jgi:hypothetical protein
MNRRLAFPLLFTCSVALLSGCDRGSSSSPAAPAGDSTHARRALEVSLIAPLLPRLRTHIAVDSRGNLYWVQESDPPAAGGDLLFAMGNSGVPQTLPALSGRRLMDSLGVGTDKSAMGAIGSIVVGPQDDLYVLVTGGTRRVPLCAVVRYTPADGKIQVVANTQQINDATGMGASIDLARGTLLGHGRDLWLWLRHSDAGIVLQLLPTPAGHAMELRRLILKPPSRSLALPLTEEQEDLAAAPDQTLLYIDRRRAMLWRIQATGEFAPVQSLEGFSAAMTAPASDDAGRLSWIAGDGDPLIHINALPPDLLPHDANAPLEWSQLSYPAFVRVESGEGHKQTLFTLQRDDFLAPTTLPMQDFQPREWIGDITNGTWVTFDAASGELVRLKLTTH